MGPGLSAGLAGVGFVEADEVVDEFALGEFVVEESAEFFLQILSIPEGPFGVEAVGFEVGLMVGVGGFLEEDGDLVGEGSSRHEVGLFLKING